MNTQRQEIEELERQLRAKRDALAWAERLCMHQWSPPQADPIYREGYTCPGDPPGTMGIDWRGPVYVPAQTTPRWKRTGKVEHTTQTTQTIQPKFT